MKKFLIFLGALLLVLVAGIYIFIPPTIHITSATVLQTTDNGAERFIMDETKWPLWWNYLAQHNTADAKQPPALFIAGRDEYRLTDKFYKAVAIRIKHNNLVQLESKMSLIPLALDSTGVEWKCSIETGFSLYKKIDGYFNAKRIKENMDTVLANLKSFLSKNENVYGIPIEKNHLKDTLYVTAKTLISSYPSTTVIYELIKKIQAYASQNGAHQTGSPIFNVTDMGNHLQLMAGIPVDKNIAEKNGFALKHMVRGFFMITEVVGGNNAVNKASENLHQFFSDYHKTSMAMNFTMLVTDRMYQPDSSKWITKIYLPVY